jgi:putative peptidoglycan binding protein
MTHDKLRTKIVTTLAALSFPALALAQSTGATNQGSSARQPSQGSDTSQRNTSQGNGSQGSGSQGSSSGSTSQGASPGTRGTSGSASGTQQQGSSSGAMSGQNSQNSMSGQGSSANAASASPGGTHMGNTQGGIDRNQIQRVFGTDTTIVDLKSLGTGEIRNLQQTLKDRGLYHGQVDGVLGPQTRAALSAMISQQYALNQRLINQGQLTGQLATSVGVDTSGVTPVNGTDMGMPSNQRQPAQPNAGQRQGQPERTRPSSPNAPQSPMPDDSDLNGTPEPVR